MMSVASASLEKRCEFPHGRLNHAPKGVAMPTRSEWKGFLQISQLQFAVKAFSSCSREPDITFNQLHRDCGERIRQQKICPVHGPIESDAIISGYQVAEDQYIPFEPDEINDLKPDSNKAIAVECFIDSQAIDPVFHTGRTLYLVPSGPPDQRPFGVMREGMRGLGRHAFSRIVISGREQQVLLRPYGKLLAMTFVEYAQRVRKTSDYESEVATVVPGESELGIARQLIETMSDQKFDLERYRDEYMDRLTSLIEQRVAAADLMNKPEPTHGANDDDAFIAVLRASLAAAGVRDTISARSPDATTKRILDDERVESRIA